MAGGYDAFDDPYSYKGTTVLKNRLGLRDLALLEAFELEMTTLRASEPLPKGKNDARHYRGVHRHLFQDVYTWAGRYRTVRTSKGGNPFCYPEHIQKQMDRLFQTVTGLVDAEDSEQFVRDAAHFLAELNAIHPFREGNGRAQLAFMSMLSQRAGFPLKFAAVRRRTFLPAMIESYAGRLDPLIAELRRLLR